MKATMGTWKRRKLVKGQRASQTKSKKARLTWVYPPEQGWPGGRPEDNGYKHRG
jgi:hypothetical protein